MSSIKNARFLPHDPQILKLNPRPALPGYRTGARLHITLSDEIIAASGVSCQVR